MNKRILLADDSLTIQKVVELTFMDEDFEVDAVGSGDEAIARLEQELPNIVIADVHMPGPSGYEVCRRAKQLGPELPVLLLIGTFEALDEDEIVACGADGNLKKPFDSQELLQLVRDMTAGAQPAAAPVAEGFETTAHAAAEEPETDEDAQDVELEVEETAANEEQTTGDETVEEPVSSVGFDFADGSLRGEPEITPVDLDSSFDSESFADALEDQATEDSVEALIEGDITAFEDALEDGARPVESAGEVEAVADGAEAAPAEVEATPAEASEEPEGASGEALGGGDVDRIARRVVELMADDTVREVAWDVIPDLAEIVIRDRIRQLEAEGE